jgi:very-short-patch-repair endonuclease
MLRGSPDEICAALARTQWGLINLSQALAAGLTMRQISARLASGKWERVAPRVYRLAGTPSSREQDEWCAFLWARGEGALALGTAARRWGFWGFEDDRVSIAVIPNGRHRGLPFDVLRYGRDCLTHVTHLGELRVTTIPRTVMDLLGRRDPRGRWMLDRSLIDRSCELADYWLIHDDPEMRGHRGRALLRERLEARSQRPPNETKGEKALWRLMEISGRVVLPHRQHWLTLLDGERIRYDFAYPDRRMAIEVDEYDAHADDEHFVSDRHRDSKCALLGWFVLRIPDADIYDRPDQVLEQIRAHYEYRSRVVV